MDKRINRRQFLQSGLIGAVAIGTGFANISYNPTFSAKVDTVRLGSTGLNVPRIAMGTGSVGIRRSSNQTRLGTSAFTKLARHAFDRGMKFYDLADAYGSHTYIREVLKEVPREETILLTKILTTPAEWTQNETPETTIDRFRTETGSEYFDILLLHCLTIGNWQEERKGFIESLSRAKQKGIIKKVGVSCHNWEAMVAAVEDPWVDVILARINPFGTHMDGTPANVMGLLETARKNGKGVIGMKIFGNGGNTSDEERIRSLKYATSSPDIHCITLGLESVAQVDDAVDKVMSYV